MLQRLFAAFISLALLSVSGSAVWVSNDVKRAKVNQLVSLLPASDSVVTMDARRFFDEALPTLLASDTEMLANVAAKLDEFGRRTGIDVRNFEFLAAGLNIRKVKAKDYDIDTVIIARGTADASSLITAAKNASDNKYKEEMVDGRSMVILSMKALADKYRATGSPTSAKHKAIAAKLHKIFASDLAITAVDTNTIAFGSPDRVRQLIAGNTRVAADVLGLLDRKEFGIVNFASRFPDGLSAFIPVENDDLGKSIESIEYAFGSMNVVEGETRFSITAKTAVEQHAVDLYNTLDVLRVFGKMALGGSKRSDQQLYARLIDRTVFARNGNEVSMDLAVPRSDLEMLVALLKKKDK